MKKIAVIMLMLFCAAPLQAQEKNVYIYKTDGTVLSYPINQISTMNFSRDTSKWPTNLMRVFYDSAMQEYGTNLVDTMLLKPDSVHGESFYVFMPRGWDGYPLFHTDSITFTPAPEPPELIGDTENTNVEWINFNYFNTETKRTNNAGFQHCGIWADSNRIYCSQPILSLYLDDSLNVVRDTDLYPLSGPLCLQLNRNHDRLLSVASLFYDVSTGLLVEYSLDSSDVTVLDSGHYNSSAVYVPGTDNIIYYSYGSYSSTNKLPPDAGYYLLDRTTGNKTLLLHHITNLGPAEMVNGFDISSDGKKLLIPSCDYNRMPRILEYDLITHQSDTLRVPFNTSNERLALWLRYNHDASKILYSCYPIGTLGGFVSDSSELGIINHATLAKQVLNVNLDTRTPWINAFPEWSPDEDKILFSSGWIGSEPPGAVNVGQLCILIKLP